MNSLPPEIPNELNVSSDNLSTFSNTQQKNFDFCKNKSTCNSEAHINLEALIQHCLINENYLDVEQLKLHLDALFPKEKQKKSHKKNQYTHGIPEINFQEERKKFLVNNVQDFKILLSYLKNQKELCSILNISQQHIAARLNQSAVEILKDKKNYNTVLRNKAPLSEVDISTFSTMSSPQIVEKINEMLTQENQISKKEWLLKILSQLLDHPNIFKNAFEPFKSVQRLFDNFEVSGQFKSSSATNMLAKNEREFYERIQNIAGYTPGNNHPLFKNPRSITLQSTGLILENSKSEEELKNMPFDELVSFYTKEKNVDLDAITTFVKKKYHSKPAKKAAFLCQGTNSLDSIINLFDYQTSFFEAFGFSSLGKTTFKNNHPDEYNEIISKTANFKPNQIHIPQDIPVLSNFQHLEISEMIIKIIGYLAQRENLKIYCFVEILRQFDNRWIEKIVNYYMKANAYKQFRRNFFNNEDDARFMNYMCKNEILLSSIIQEGFEKYIAQLYDESTLAKRAGKISTLEQEEAELAQKHKKQKVHEDENFEGSFKKVHQEQDINSFVQEESPNLYTNFLKNFKISQLFWQTLCDGASMNQLDEVKESSQHQNRFAGTNDRVSTLVPKVPNNPLQRAQVRPLNFFETRSFYSEDNHNSDKEVIKVEEEEIVREIDLALLAEYMSTKIVPVLRKNHYVERTNCVYLVRALLDFFEKGKKPSKAAPNKNFSTQHYMDWAEEEYKDLREIIKTETEDPISDIRKIAVGVTVSRETEYGKKAPPTISHPIDEHGIINVESLCYDEVAHYPKIRVVFSELENRLMEEARQDKDGFSYGDIGVEDLEQEYGHLLAYFSTKTGCLIFDLQQYSPLSKKNACTSSTGVYFKIKDVYPTEFLELNGENSAPLGPYLFFNSMKQSSRFLDFCEDNGLLIKSTAELALENEQTLKLEY